MKSTGKRHIKILGSGPSGLSAAINLRKSDIDVTVFEVNKSPCERFINGWQILENYTRHIPVLEELAGMNINLSDVVRPANSMPFYDYRLNRFDFKSDKPFGYYVKRGNESDTIDMTLYKQAIQCGAQFRFGFRLDERDADIIAGGRPAASGISKELVFSSDSPDRFMTIIDNHLTPFGFAYLFIINGRGTIGTAVLKDFKNISKYSDAVLLRFQQIEKFSITDCAESVSSVGFFVPATATVNGQLYIGEAAGFQDYLFGLGIRRSIQSGYLAAQSIIENSDYDLLWKNYFGKQLTANIFNRFSYELAGNIGLSTALNFCKTFDFRNLGYRLHNPSFFRRMISEILMKTWKVDKTKINKFDNRTKWFRNPN